MTHADNPSRLLVAFVQDRDRLKAWTRSPTRDWGDETMVVGTHAAYVWMPAGVLESPMFEACRQGARHPRHDAQLGDGAEAARDDAGVGRLIDASYVMARAWCGRRRPRCSRPRRARNCPTSSSASPDVTIPASTACRREPAGSRRSPSARCRCTCGPPSRPAPALVDEQRYRLGGAAIADACRRRCGTPHADSRGRRYAAATHRCRPARPCPAGCATLNGNPVGDASGSVFTRARAPAPAPAERHGNRRACQSRRRARTPCPSGRPRRLRREPRAGPRGVP